MAGLIMWLVWIAYLTLGVVIEAGINLLPFAAAVLAIVGLGFCLLVLAGKK
jgi:hypothetical protein